MSIIDTLRTETDEFDAVMANLRQCSRHHLHLFHQASSQAMRYRAALERIKEIRGMPPGLAAEIAEKALEDGK